MSISIVLADEHPIVRFGLRGLFSPIPELAIVGETSDGLEAVRFVERLKPDVLILDLMMSGLNGLDVLALVAQRSPRTRAIVFSMYAHEDYVRQALKGGAVAYILKGDDPNLVVDAIRHAIAGTPYVSPALAERLSVMELDQVQDAKDPHDKLTPRERQVLQLAAEGHTGPEAAARLNISPRTVEMHRANGMRKLGLKTAADLFRYAMRRRMIPPVN